MKFENAIKLGAMAILFTVLSSTFVLADDVPKVSWVAEDTVTKGNWQGKYGSYAYILPDAPAVRVEIPIGYFNSPAGFDINDPLTWSLMYNEPFNWYDNQVNGLPYYRPVSPYWDVIWSQSPVVSYSVAGTSIAKAEATVQHPVFSWAWDVYHDVQTDPREVYFPASGKWRLTTWDDGNERGEPEHGYMNFTLFFPKGNYRMSLYAYDYEMFTRASQMYRIYDQFGGLMVTKQISGTAFKNGVHEIFQVVAPHDGYITIQVYNDAGHVPICYPYPVDKTLNVVLSGIFIDKTSN